MNIIHFSQFYFPETSAGAFGAVENDRVWAKMGAQVTVFTAYPNHPGGKLYKGYVPRLITIEHQETDSKIKIIRSKLIIKRSTTYLNKFFNTFTFFLFGLVNFIINRNEIDDKYDIVIAANGMVFGSMLGFIYAMWHKIPFVFEVRDLTYLQLVGLGKNKNALSVRIMKYLEISMAKKATAVVSLTEGFKTVLSKNGVENNKITVITNGVNVNEVLSVDYDENASSVVLGYYGVLGKCQNLTKTFSYADQIAKYCKKFKYIIIGEGAQRKQVEEAVSHMDNPSIELLHGMDPDKLESYYSKTTLAIAALEKNDLFKDTIPSKVFQIMARGIAVLYIGPEGEASRMIKENGTGIVLTKNRTEDLKTLDCFFRQGDWYGRLKMMGANGRRLVEQKYSRTKLAEKYYSVLRNVAGINE